MYTCMFKNTQKERTSQLKSVFEPRKVDKGWRTPGIVSKLQRI
jgi:hypothetical protein